MAKEVRKKYVKLGEKASSFSCPTTGISITGDTVIELIPIMQSSKKFIAALKGGHLEYADSSEVPEEEDEDTSGQVNEAFLNSKNKADLIPLALELLDDEDEEDEDDIQKMKKQELVEFIILKNNQ